MVDERHDSDEQLADVAEPGEVQLSPGLIDKINDLKEELAETEARFQKAEARSNTLLETQIASSQLHQALTLEDASRVLTEIMLNFVGVESYAVVLTNAEGTKLVPLVAVGVSEDALRKVDATEGRVGACLSSGQPYTAESLEGEARELTQPKACIPLRVGSKRIGLLLAYRFLSHKTEVRAAELHLYRMLSSTILSCLMKARLLTRMGLDVDGHQELVDFLAGEGSSDG